MLLIVVRFPICRDDHHDHNMVYTDSSYEYGHYPVSYGICDLMVWIQHGDYTFMNHSLQVSNCIWSFKDSNGKASMSWCKE